jgi:hypothetical protein
VHCIGEVEWDLESAQRRNVRCTYGKEVYGTGELDWEVQSAQRRSVAILLGRTCIVLLNWAKTWRSHRTSNMHEAQTEILSTTQKPSYCRYKIPPQALQHICFTLSYVTSCSQWLILTLSFTLHTHVLRHTVPICARHLVYGNYMSGLVFEISERNMPPPPSLNSRSICGPK